MQVCEQTHWTWPAPIDTLAAAYAETGDFDSAIEWEKKFLSYPISDTTAKEGQAHLELYQSHQPYRSGGEPAAHNDNKID